MGRGSPTPEDLTQLAEQCERLERRRRVGVICLYSPLFGLSILIATMASFSTPPASSANPAIQWLYTVLMMVAGTSMLISVPLLLVGIAIRAISAWRLTRLTGRLDMLNLAPWPPVRKGETFSELSVTALEPGRCVVTWRPAPRVVWLPVCWSVNSITTGAVAALIATIAASPGSFLSLIVPSILLFAIWCSTVLLFVSGSTWQIEADESNWRVTHTRTSMIFIRNRSIVVAPRAWCASDGSVPLAFEGPHKRINIPGFAGGVLGNWQQRRLLHTLRLSIELSTPPTDDAEVELSPNEDNVPL